MNPIMQLKFFNQNSNFPFFIQYGFHDEPMFLHSHLDFYELVIVLEGSATHIVDNQRYQISMGDIFVIGNDTLHGFDDPIGFKICNLMFRPDLLLDADYDIKTSEGFHKLFVLEPYLSMEQGFVSRLKLKPKEHNLIFPMVTKLVWEYENKSFGWQTFIYAGFLELIVFLSRIYADIPQDSSTGVLSLAAPVAYMESHYMDNLKMEDLAALAGFSVRHFSRLFQKTYHIPPLHYLMNIRLQKAAVMLKSTTISVSDIGFQCGFEDSNYFSRQFKKYYQISPSVFRRGWH